MVTPQITLKVKMLLFNSQQTRIKEKRRKRRYQVTKLQEAANKIGKRKLHYCSLLQVGDLRLRSMDLHQVQVTLLNQLQLPHNQLRTSFKHSSNKLSRAARRRVNPNLTSLMRLTNKSK